MATEFCMLVLSMCVDPQYGTSVKSPFWRLEL